VTEQHEIDMQLRLVMHENILNEQILHEHEFDHIDDYINGEIFLILDLNNLQIEMYFRF
jgi:hypothetical protein